MPEGSAIAGAGTMREVGILPEAALCRIGEIADADLAADGVHGAGHH